MKCENCGEELTDVTVVCNIKHILEDEMETRGNLWRRVTYGKDTVVMREAKVVEGKVELNDVLKQLSIEHEDVVEYAMMIICGKCKLGIGKKLEMYIDGEKLEPETAEEGKEEKEETSVIKGEGIH